MTRRLFALLVLSLAVVVFFPAAPATGDEADCDVGDAAWNAAVTYDAGNDECDLNSAVTQSGTLTLGHTLHIGPTGAITVPVGQTLTLDIDGDLLMDAGSKIASAAATGAQVGGSTVVNATGEIFLAGGSPGAEISANGSPLSGGCSGGKAGNITLTAAGDITTEDGSLITANSKCPAGEIKILSPTGNIEIDGLVQSRSTTTGTGAVQRPGGGPITITTGCNLDVSDTGVISSSGLDPGADLVHLEAACDVTILGLVESTGAGHALPNSPTNHCYYQQAGFPSPPQTPVNPADDPQDPRTDKPPSATACVEVWAGRDLTINKATANGEVSTDLTLGAGHQAWIDLFARNTLTILGGTGTGDCAAGRTADAFAVHSNSGGNNALGGQITIKSTEGALTATGFAVMADGTTGSGVQKGGNLDLEAFDDVTLNTARLCARGDFNPTGGFGNGGKIGTTATDPDTPGIKSWNGTVSWTDGIGDVRPTGTNANLAANKRGEIVMQDCTAGPIDRTGTAFPNNGLPATTPTEMTDACGGAPTLPSYVTLQVCTKQPDPGQITIIKNAVPDDVQDFGFTGDLGPFTLDDDGNELNANPSSKNFPNLPPGDYDVTETLPVANWSLTTIVCDDGSQTNTTTGTANIVLGSGEHVTCTFTNTADPGSALVNKTTNGVVNPAFTWNFTLNGPGVNVSDSTAADGTVDFNGAQLTPGETYTICETNIPAGWTSTWELDGNPITPDNPDFPDDFGNRCYDFTVTPGQDVVFDIDNTNPVPPGGDQRTIGYWKNWNRCTKGNQAATADKNGGAAAGFFLVENVIPQLIGDFNVDTCAKAVKVLSKKDQSGRNKANDAAYALAAQLLAAKFNVAAGAGTCLASQDAITGGQDLLNAINFTGSGSYLPPTTSSTVNRALALHFASLLDQYNNGTLCP